MAKLFPKNVLLHCYNDVLLCKAISHENAWKIHLQLLSSLEGCKGPLCAGKVVVENLLILSQQFSVPDKHLQCQV